MGFTFEASQSRYKQNEDMNNSAMDALCMEQQNEYDSGGIFQKKTLMENNDTSGGLETESESEDCIKRELALMLTKSKQYI